MDVEGDRASVSIVGADLEALVGEEGDVLEALQELTRLAVYRETGERSRLMLDIGGYRAEVRKNLEILAEEAIDDVRQSGEAVKLAPMTPFERKVVHDAVACGGTDQRVRGRRAHALRRGAPAPLAGVVLPCRAVVSRETHRRRVTAATRSRSRGGGVL